MIFSAVIRQISAFINKWGAGDTEFLTVFAFYAFENYVGSKQAFLEFSPLESLDWSGARENEKVLFISSCKYLEKEW